MHMIDYASHAMQEVRVKPNIKPIRGGTDSAPVVLYGASLP